VPRDAEYWVEHLRANCCARHIANAPSLQNVSSHYSPITTSVAQDIVTKYQYIPGGLIFEDGSPDLAFVKKATYLASANAFILNDDIV
jgi:hypothetical protein